MINYKTYQPDGCLAEYVRYFWSLEVEVERMNGPFVHRALPDNCIELIFYCRGKLSISSSDGMEGSTFHSGVFGQAKKFRQFKTNQNFRLFGAYLYPHAFMLLFNLPASELLNLKVDSETLWGDNGRVLEERVITAETDLKRVQLVSDFLFKRISITKNHENGFIENFKSVVDNNRVLSIETFADRCNLSRRQFERKFKDFSGFSPKDFFSIVRFKNVLKEIGHGKSLAQVAVNVGYFDQSHFTNEFKKLTGYSPREFAINQFKAADTRATVDFK
ncbi:helix-turn-helix transcriptional regulator [Pseudochryseolinea flava]|nr:helix-turn-helix transcriptional regulator [Pseudochryseolinea flava]